jgi:hypothetical protein
VVRYTQEVAEYARRLSEVDERTREAPLEMVEEELEKLRASTGRASLRASKARS